MRWLFGFFLVSGFCSILYELVWLRLAMASFGVTTALVSIVLSTFMAGLGLGSWGSGYLIRKFGGRLHIRTLRIYAATEFLIGLSAIVVPYQLSWGHVIFMQWSLSSLFFYFVSGLWVAVTLIPWCVCMGATIPVGMLCIKKIQSGNTSRSFSFLYLANVLGAVAGAIIPLFFIELYGFRGTLKIGAALNILLAASAFALSFSGIASESGDEAAQSAPVAARNPAQNRKPLVLLFATGLTSMGMEVVWIRLFTPFLGTVVYAFAAILSIYLLATFAGSALYRRSSRSHNPRPILIWALLGLSALLPLVTTAARVASLHEGLRVLFGLGPFSMILGFVTPMLVDRWSGGDPDRAGRAYAINVAGCILGPLLSGFILLPWIGERWALLLLSMPWFLLSLYPQWFSSGEMTSQGVRRRQAVAIAALIIGIFLAVRSKDYSARFAHHKTLRDSTATVSATGEGMEKHLLVNGIGMTTLTPVTKMMVHLPLAFLSHPPRNVLIICFGMGTTYRSALSWGVPTTAVELVPSVPKLMGYYYREGPQLLQSPLGHVVIDDGRRYLERTTQRYDMITLDPPPPVEAAGSSMLYSKEFYSLIKLHLRPGGILQIWLPAGDETVHSAVAKAIKESFPYVRAFGSVGHWGNQFLVSNEPIPDWTPQQLVAHMPAKAVVDMMEWGPASTPTQQFATILNTEFPIDQLIAQAPNAPALQDDRPVNEYYLLRQNFPGLTNHIHLLLARSPR
jgi:predicted membrane-bound spermidine synthase